MTGTVTLELVVTTTTEKNNQTKRVKEVRMDSFKSQNKKEKKTSPKRI